MLTSQDEPLKPKLQSLIKTDPTLSVIFNGEAAISYYKTAEQKLYLKANVIESLASMLSLLNVSRNIDARQIEPICEIIITDPEFKGLSPTELREAFKRGVKGNYGDNFQTIDLPRIMGWVRCYADERFAAIERYRDVEISILRTEAKQPIKALENLNLAEKFKPKEDPKEKQPHREKTAGEIEFDGYLKEFDVLWKAQPHNHDLSLKIVDYKDEKMDISQYSNYRWEEVRG